MAASIYTATRALGVPASVGEVADALGVSVRKVTRRYWAPRPPLPRCWRGTVTESDEKRHEGKTSSKGYFASAQTHALRADSASPKRFRNF